MKRKLNFNLRLVPAIAALALASGCGSPTPSADNPPKESENKLACVDKDGNVVPAAECETEDQRRGSSGYVPMHYWYMMNPTYRGGYPALGSHLTGGTMAPSSATLHSVGGTVTGSTPSSTHHTSTVRGGFGSSGHTPGSTGGGS